MNKILFFLIFMYSSASAQQNAGPTDSLQKMLDNNKTEDTNRVWLLVRLTNAYFTSEPDRAMQYADEALRISEKIQWSKGRVISYKVKGGVFFIKTDYVNAIEYWQKSLKADSGKSKFHEASIRNNMATVFREMKQYEKAKENYNQYIDVMTGFNNKEELAMGYSNLGSILHLEKKYDSAEICLYRGLKLAQETGNIRVESTALCILGSVYKETGRNEEAVEYSKRSIEKANESQNLYVKAPALNNLAHAYRNLGELEKAETYSKQSLELAKQINNANWQYEAWEELSRIYEKQLKPALALTAFKNFIQLRDSVLDNEKKQEITRKEILLEAEKKEAVLTAQHIAAVREKQIQSNTILGGSGLMIAAGILGFILYKRKKDAMNKQQEAELKAEILDTEMKALRAQMNPHFIFNALNSIGDYISKNDSSAASEYLGNFARLMRLTLENSDKKLVSLADELNTLELYMILEAHRLKNKFNYNITVDAAIDPDNTMVPPLLLQPFVENAIWHGFTPKEGNGNIQIRIHKEGDMINCTIEDNGVGRKNKTSEVKNMRTSGPRSMGTSITLDRINTLNKTNNSNATVALFDLTEGLRAEIKLPLLLRF